MMQEYEDDFFFEEDKMDDLKQESPKNIKSKLSLSVDLGGFKLDTFNEAKDYCRIPATKGNAEINSVKAEFSHPIVENRFAEFSLEADNVYNDLRKKKYLIQNQDLMGMTVTSGSVTLQKDEKNLIGISIGGGAPLCPCLYIVQIFDNTPAARDGTLQSGDELVGVGGTSVKGKTKVEVAKMIQAAKDEVTINYNKLHADPKQGKSLDIIMKKMKHRLVENMSSGTADALGLSRAILCNDTLVAKLKELRDTETMYKRLVDHAKRMLKAYFDLLQTFKSVGDVFAAIGVREPQARASEAFTKFGHYHRLLERDGINMLKALKPVSSSFYRTAWMRLFLRNSLVTSGKGMVVYQSLFTPRQFYKETVVTCLVTLKKEARIRVEALRSRATLILADMGTYLKKAIPDTKLTIKKYADTKFEYLSYCLKVKEMDDEEYGYNALQEPLYRVETGNYEYRLILRCRQEARERFARLRSDVLVKLELLDSKRARDVAYQLAKLTRGLAAYHEQTVAHLQENAKLFPVEVDLSQNAFQYKSTTQLIQDNQDEDEDIEFGKEVQEYHDIEDSGPTPATRKEDRARSEDGVEEKLLHGLDCESSNPIDSVDNLTLLTELGLADMPTDPTEFGDFQNGLIDEFLPQNDTDNVFDKLLSEFGDNK
ncbi:PRKCA-binding protein [Eumeta japonica]|uniref:PRKCA-binding protein n=1 Tax=Eumeta variegata TaxID=151549 RepID=A0A4C1W5A2_EUMVA|nr:PRKCA-binding protein [Eumeta japonica]